MLGVIVAVWLSERRWRARGGQAGTIVDIAVPAVIFGLIGGRLYHVITDWQTYFGSRAIKEPYQALFIWEGGLGIWGAVSLGALGVWLAVRKRGLSMSAVADTVAPGIAFAQGIGRWGNWFNQELYGSPTTLPWGLEIDVEHGGEPGVLYHPTFLYESLWDVALGFLLIFAGRRFALHHGRLFALYVAGYTLGRFWIEGLRIDPVGGVDHAVEFLGLRINQWTSIVLFVLALVYFFATRNKTGEEIVALPESGPDEPDPAHGAGQADPGTGESSSTTTDSSSTTTEGSSGEPPSGASSADEADGDKPSGTDKPGAEASASDASGSDASASDTSVSDAPGSSAAGASGASASVGADPAASGSSAQGDDVVSAAAQEEGEQAGPVEAETVTKEKNPR
ncbi:prolipoprotein diacylglyceryl transferase [Nonomuraea salmonea]|uniref:prolipoprotein diacylglyceryl transferase n=1 Tax=Nonomuraea salmonea TaxID=46181 RepID=UPI003A956BDB